MSTVRGNTDTYPYAKRVVAYLVDAFILNILTRIGLYLTYGLSTYLSVISLTLLVVTYFLYFVYLHWKAGQTIGKKLLKIQLASASGDLQVSLSQIFVRELIKFFPDLIIFLMIIYLHISGDDNLLADLFFYLIIPAGYHFISIGIAGLNAKTQAIHDLIVQTVVIDSGHNS
jgi:uncharacterized RDD family membrane protein YckC